MFLMLIVAYVVFFNVTRMVETANWVKHTHEVIADARELGKLIVDMETGERGFLITGKEPFLEPFNEAQKIWDKKIEKLKGHVSDNQEQVSRLEVIDSLANQWLTVAAQPEIDARIESSKTGGKVDNVIALVNARTGKKIIDTIRVKVDEFIKVEHDLINIRDLESKKAASRTTDATIHGIALAIFMALVSALLVSAKIAGGLGVLVERTREISSGNLIGKIKVKSGDEIGELGKAFNQMTEKLRSSTTSIDNLNIEVAEHRQTENLLQAERDRFKTILETSPNGVYIVDQQYKIEYINPVIKKDFGSVDGQKCYEYFHDRAQPCPWCKNDEVLKGRSVRWEWFSEKSKKHYDLFDTPLKNADGSISKFEMFYDITDRKRMEEELIQAKKLETMSTFSAGLAHDFNNLLGGVLGYITLSKDDVEKQKDVSAFLDEAEKIALNARDLTAELLTLSGSGISHRYTTNPCKLIKDISLISLKGSSVNCEFILPEEVCDVKIDPKLLNQVVSSIIKNARESMPDGGILKIRAEQFTYKEEEENRLPLTEGMYFLICISDTGCGISSKNMSRIFDPYFSTKERGVQKGMGFSLPVAYSVISKLNGSIRVKSEEGVGTDVFIYLPAVQKTLVTHDVKKEEIVKKIGGPKKILFMDDEEFIRLPMKRILERLGHEVELACHGEEAIQKYAHARNSGHPFDAVILDLTIKGGMGGKQTIEELLKIEPSVKAIVASGYSDDPVLSNCKEYGFCASLPKPSSKAKIIEALEKLC